MTRVIEYEKVRDLERFLASLRNETLTIVHGPHVVLEDHSELGVFKVYRGENLVAYIVAHYITQYYRAILKGEYVEDEEYLRRLLEIKYSGEKWSIPVNPVYIVVYDEEILNKIMSYEDDYPVVDGAKLVEEYRSRNPSYKSLPRIVLARLVE